MKRFVLALFVSSAAFLPCGTAAAQSSTEAPPPLNDLRLANGVDLIYTYSDPSIGVPVGLSGVPDFATNDYFWKVMPAETLRHCSGLMEVTGMDIWSFDGDYGTFEGPNNTALADSFLSRALSGIPIEPDKTDPTGVLISFGPGGPKNNVFLSNPGCPPPGYVYGYELDVDITGGGGAGLVIPANGIEPRVFTTFLPGGDHTFSGPNSCANGNGDGVTPDAHSSDASGAIGETQFDLVGGGVASLFGGFGSQNVTLGADGVHEMAQKFLEFREPTLAMVVDSATGQGPEEGLAGVHYDCPPGVGGSLAASLYALQGLGRPAAVMGTLAPPLPACLNFKGGKLGISPVDPLFNVFLGLWQGVVLPSGNDGIFTSLSLPLPPQLVPVGVTVPLSFQGVWVKLNGTIESSQVTRLFFHG